MLYRRVCRNCNKEFTGSDYSVISSLVFCDACWNALPKKIEQIGDQGALGSGASQNIPTECETPEPEFPLTRVTPKTHSYELHWVGTNRTSALPVVLADAPDGGYVGRDSALCDTGIDKPTISRIQFAYKHAENGLGIVITNYSQFGTWVNGQLLQRNDSAIAPLGSTIEMGGFVFELHERDDQHGL